MLKNITSNGSYFFVRFKHTESDELKYHQRSKLELESLQRLYDTLVTDHKILEAK